MSKSAVADIYISCAEDDFRSFFVIFSFFHLGRKPFHVLRVAELFSTPTDEFVNRKNDFIL